MRVKACSHLPSELWDLPSASTSFINWQGRTSEWETLGLISPVPSIPQTEGKSESNSGLGRSYTIWPHWRPHPLTLGQGTACISSAQGPELGRAGTTGAGMGTE